MVLKLDWNWLYLQETHQAFDIHKYGEEILESFRGEACSNPIYIYNFNCNKNNTAKFTSIDKVLSYLSIFFAQENLTKLSKRWLMKRY